MASGNPAKDPQLGKVAWDEVGVPDTVKECLMKAVEYLKGSSQSSTEGERPWRGCLLYGPPGVGKSYVARAVETAALAAGVHFIRYKTGRGDSIWRDMGKRVRDVFKTATAVEGGSRAIVFIDDLEWVCGRQCEGETSVCFKQAEAELLSWFAKIERNNSDTLVLAATQKPFSIHQRLVARFDRRLYVPLPALAHRRLIFKLHLAQVADVGSDVSEDDISDLAEKTEGFSGSDISVLVKDAALEPFREVQKAPFFHKSTQPGGGTTYTPCPPRKVGGPRDPSIITATWNHLMDQGLTSQVIVRKVQRADFDTAVARCQCSVGEEDLAVYRRFEDQFEDPKKEPGG